MYQDDLPQPRFLDTELEMWSEQCQMEKTININARISLQEQMSSNKWLIFTGQQKKNINLILESTNAKTIVCGDIQPAKILVRVGNK